VDVVVVAAVHNLEFKWGKNATFVQVEHTLDDRNLFTVEAVLYLQHILGHDPIQNFEEGFFVQNDSSAPNEVFQSQEATFGSSLLLGCFTLYLAQSSVLVFEPTHRVYFDLKRFAKTLDLIFNQFFVFFLVDAFVYFH